VWRALSSAARPTQLGALGGPCISNKHTILHDVDRALSPSSPRPPDVEVLHTAHLAYTGSRLSRFLHHRLIPLGHVLVRYTTSDGQQYVMNILGGDALERGGRMVNFGSPAEYLFGTEAFNGWCQQGGAYNRDIVGVRIERAPGTRPRAAPRTARRAASVEPTARSHGLPLQPSRPHPPSEHRRRALTGFRFNPRALTLRFHPRALILPRSTDGVVDALHAYYRALDMRSDIHERDPLVPDSDGTPKRKPGPTALLDAPFRARPRSPLARFELFGGRVNNFIAGHLPPVVGALLKLLRERFAARSSRGGASSDGLGFSLSVKSLVLHEERLLSAAGNCAQARAARPQAAAAASLLGPSAPAPRRAPSCPLSNLL
jgi:hypothetical protein